MASESRLELFAPRSCDVDNGILKRCVSHYYCGLLVELRRRGVLM